MYTQNLCFQSGTVIDSRGPLSKEPLLKIPLGTSPTNLSSICGTVRLLRRTSVCVLSKFNQKVDNGSHKITSRSKIKRHAAL